MPILRRLRRRAFQPGISGSQKPDTTRFPTRPWERYPVSNQNLPRDHPAASMPLWQRFEPSEPWDFDDGSVSVNEPWSCDASAVGNRSLNGQGEAGTSTEDSYDMDDCCESRRAYSTFATSHPAQPPTLTWGDFVGDSRVNFAQGLSEDGPHTSPSRVHWGGANDDLAEVPWMGNFGSSTNLQLSTLSKQRVAKEIGKLEWLTDVVTGDRVVSHGTRANYKVDFLLKEGPNTMDIGKISIPDTTFSDASSSAPRSMASPSPRTSRTDMSTNRRWRVSVAERAFALNHVVDDRASSVESGKLSESPRASQGLVLGSSFGSNVSRSMERCEDVFQHVDSEKDLLQKTGVNPNTRFVEKSHLKKDAVDRRKQARPAGSHPFWAPLSRRGRERHCTGNRRRAAWWR